MENKTQHGYLVLADISGYTSFLAKTELEHAHEILTELLNLIVTEFSSMLTFSKFEGDCVFSYVSESKLSRGETLLELVEATYMAFRDLLQTCARRTTCTCNACRAIPTLDLKFMVHYGDYILQELVTGKELVGSDVNLVHRLLKNHITEGTGWRAYALFTEKALEHMCVQPEDMHRQIEAYEHLGDVPTLTLDLHARHKALTDARRVFITPEEANVTRVQEFPVAPAVLWDWLNDPDKRSRYTPGKHWSLGQRAGGRTGVGAANHCAHGKNSTSTEKIVDWRPFDYFTTYSEIKMGLVMKMTWTNKLETVPAGTCVRSTIKLDSPLPGFLNQKVANMIGKMAIDDSWKYLLPLLKAETGTPDNHVTLSDSALAAAR